MPRYIMKYAMLSGMMERQLDTIDELEVVRLEVEGAGGTVLSVRDERGLLVNTGPAAAGRPAPLSVR